MTRSDYTYAADNQLFQRNPVCGVCWRICMDMCEEWGGQINFDLLASMEVADRLCRRLINNTWTLCGIEYYYHWLESELGYSSPAITCATATVCLTLQLMEDAPQPLLQLGADMHGLLWGEGGELYANMRSAARQEDIYLSANHYGEIPPDPYAEIKEENQLLKLQNKQLKEQITTMKKESTPQTVINVAGNYIAEQNIDIHDNTHCTIYATEAPQKTPPTETDKAALLPQEGDYQAVVKWLQVEKEKGEDYYAQAQFNRSKMCRQLSNIFGWIVNENSLRKAQN